MAGIGPQLPPARAGPAAAAAAVEDADAFGPSLPPELAATRTASRGPLGPALPPWLERSRTHASSSASEVVVGPLPPSSRGSAPRGGDDDDEAATIAREFEERAAAYRSKLTDVAPATDETRARGEWMLKPPEYDIGAGDPLRSRKFSQKDVTKQDSSVWTDTPADRARKAEEARKRFEAGAKDGASGKRRRDEEDDVLASRANAETAKKVDEYNKQHRSRSLMDEYHRQVLPSKVATVEDVSKLPFDRERDLQVRRIDPNKRKQFIAQAGELKTRFGHASGSSFL